MSPFWYRLLGVDVDRIPKGAETELVWANAPRSWGVFVLLAVVAAAVYGVFYLYRREISTCPRRVRIVLAVLRATVLVLLAVVFLGPALAVAVPRVVQPYVVLLLDDSLSMSIEDRYLEDEAAQRVARATGQSVEQVRLAKPSRAALVDRLLLERDGRFLQGLAERGHVRVLSFSDTVKLRASLRARAEASVPAGEAEPGAGLPRGEPVPPLAPAGPSTNLHRGLREALKALAGSPVAGIVLVSDGQATEGDDPLKAAEVAASQKVPIFVLGVGDAAEPRNLTVAEVSAPDSVFREDPFTVEARLRARGFQGQRIEVELLRRRADQTPETGPGDVVARKTVLVGDAAAEEKVAFEHRQGTAGEFVYSVRVRPPAELERDETLTSDNLKSVAVRVLSEKARVLVVAGAPSWDFRLVRTLFVRDKTIDVSCWLQSNALDMPQDGNTVIKKLPATPEELFAYDVILMLDPDPGEFSEEWLAMLKRFLGEHGGGLLWQAGPRYASRFFHGVRTRTVHELLPVRLGEREVFDVRFLSVTHRHEWPIRVTGAGMDHPVLLLDRDPAANRRLWDVAPGVYWSYATQGAKPAAQVLLEHGDPRLRRNNQAQPLVVAGQYGPGRTLYLGFESVWRWRELGEPVFDRFWVQAVRYLIEGRLMGGRKRGRIGADRDVYALGSRVAITARLYDAAFKPLTAPTVEARVGAGDRTVPVVLRAVPGRPGAYGGTTVASQIGLNEITVWLPGRALTERVRVSRQFTIEAPRVEYNDPRLNVRLLTDVATRSGGAYFGVDQYEQIPTALPKRQETLIIQGKPVELWDTGRLLILLVALLSVEWALRKRYWLL